MLVAAAVLVLAQIPGTLPPQCNLLTTGFSMSSAIFCLQTSYKLGFCWLFTLFPRRSARCSSCAQGELGSAPTYLTAIFQPLRISFQFRIWVSSDKYPEVKFLGPSLCLVIDFVLKSVLYKYCYPRPFVCFFL